MMGIGVHSRSSRVTSMPSRSGRPRSRITRSGRCASDGRQRLLAVGGLEHGVAVRRQGGAQEAPDGRLVVHDQHARPALAHGFSLPAACSG